MTGLEEYAKGARVRVVRELSGGVVGIAATVVRLDTGPNVWILPDEPVRIGVFAPGEPVLVGTHNLEELPRPIHKAEPFAQWDGQTLGTACRHCGQAIKRVPGGHGPVWVHADTGAVVGSGPESEAAA